MDFWKPLLDVTINGPKFLLACTLVSVLLLAYLLLKKFRLRWYVTALIAAAAGALIGLGVLYYVQFIDNSFGEPLLPDVWLWVPLAFAAICVAIVNLRGGRWWRSVISALAVLAFLATATFQINAAYGLNATIGAMFNLNTAPTIGIPPKDEWAQPVEGGEIYKTWQAPANMPKVGSQGRTPVQIPNTNSGFQSRWSGLYLPPAALVKNPPRLPFVIWMMGQPGFPSTKGIGAVADAMAARHHGLAPIILVVDQLGDPNSDPLCLDTKMGKVETYVMKDVLPWARANLPIEQDRKHWTFMGYSNGGVCAAYFGAKYPNDFGSYVSISGEQFQGSEKPAVALANAFGGNQAAYDAVKPLNIMKKHGKYTDMIGIYTAGTKDISYTAQAKSSVAAAKKMGIHATYVPVQGAAHVKGAVDGGLFPAFEMLYARWGLAPSGG